jgi:glucoamylase
MPARKILRVIVEAEATIVWSGDGWVTTNQSDTAQLNGLNLWYADLPTEGLAIGSIVEFTFFWIAVRRWEGRNWQISVN